MNKLTKYQAVDGREFKFLEDCLKYENDLHIISNIELELISRPDNTNFLNGGGYIQQKESSVVSAMIKTIKLLDIPEDIKDKALQSPFKSRFGIIDRYLDDCDLLHRKIWYRFMCIDDQYREWGQPYFAMNPDKGNQRKI